MNTEPKRTLEEVLLAIKGSGGIKTAIAQRLGVNRVTVDAYLLRWKSAQAAYDEENEITLDVAESVILGNIRAAAKQVQAGEIADSGDAWKLLRLKGAARGYKEVSRQEVEHSGDIATKAYIGISPDDWDSKPTDTA
jgi:hypothetical protein